MLPGLQLVIPCTSVSKDQSRKDRDDPVVHGVGRTWFVENDLLGACQHLGEIRTELVFGPLKEANNRDKGFNGKGL